MWQSLVSGTDLITLSNELNGFLCPALKLVVNISAMKIQCSSSTYSLLEQFGGYVLICRGTFQIKVCSFYVMK